MILYARKRRRKFKTHFFFDIDGEVIQETIELTVSNAKAHIKYCCECWCAMIGELLDNRIIPRSVEIDGDLSYEIASILSSFNRYLEKLYKTKNVKGKRLLFEKIRDSLEI